MEDSLLCLDVYSIIVQNADWTTLTQLVYVNKYLKWLAKKELETRWVSDQPLADPKSKLVIITQDIYLENIFCCSGETKIWIDPKDWSKVWLRYLLNELFTYSLPEEKRVISNRLFQQLIRLINKKITQTKEPINQHRQTMVFGQNGLEWILERYY